jgi:hypothetical protein
MSQFSLLNIAYDLHPHGGFGRDKGWNFPLARESATSRLTRPMGAKKGFILTQQAA